MTDLLPFSCALALCAALAMGSARADTCDDRSSPPITYFTCDPSHMPADGYCECRTGGGTVVAAPVKKPNAPAGGCAADPSAPGCK
jgi:hypothetical protein